MSRSNWSFNDFNMMRKNNHYLSNKFSRIDKRRRRNYNKRTNRINKLLKNIGLKGF